VKKTTFYYIATALIATVLLSSADKPNEKKEKTLIGSVNEIIATYHYQPSKLDDSLSAHTFNLFIKRLDYEKQHFLQSDINALETYKYLIDEEIKEAKYNFFDLANEIIEQRVDESEKICDSILSMPFNFWEEEQFDLDEEKRSYPKTRQEKVELWRKTLKSHTVYRLYEIEKNKKADAEKFDSVSVPPFDTLELQARNYVKKKYESRFKRIKQEDREDKISLYVNCFTNASDPHTGYFPPKDKENFDISISGKLEGIGATLMEKDGNIKVTNIVPGSASWKQGDLAAGDIILKVGQGEEEPVDIVGMRLDDAVQLIRGPKGSLVKLTVKKLDGSTTLIPIIRDIVIIEETYAKSTILTDDIYKSKIGYIYLPKFYVDFANSNGRRCSEDILEEINKLKKDDIKGLILDLRDNGGGSLSDVVTIGGYFIKEGPIVQVKSKYITPKILSDTDPDIKYDGPLVIMVNKFSASASEILAAAMQDYKRAIIVGSPSTYGKGTVQRFLTIDRFLPKEDADVSPLGDLKITIQKFYRINGGATQLKGVTPDIILADKYKYTDIGEIEQDFPMEWDEIAPVSYETWQKPFDLKKVEKANAKLLKNDTIFSLLENLAQILKQNRKNTSIELQFDTYKKDREANELSESIKNVGKEFTGLETVKETSDTTDISKLDSVKLERSKRWHEDIQKDIELYHTYKLLNESL